MFSIFWEMGCKRPSKLETFTLALALSLRLVFSYFFLFRRRLTFVLKPLKAQPTNALPSLPPIDPLFEELHAQSRGCEDPNRRS